MDVVSGDVVGATQLIYGDAIALGYLGEVFARGDFVLDGFALGLFARVFAAVVIFLVVVFGVGHCIGHLTCLRCGFGRFVGLGVWYGVGCSHLRLGVGRGCAVLLCGRGHIAALYGVDAQCLTSAYAAAYAVGTAYGLLTDAIAARNGCKVFAAAHLVVFDDDFFDILAAVSGGDGGAGGWLDDIAAGIQLGVMVDYGVFVGYITVGLNVGEDESVWVDISRDDVGAVLGIEYAQFVHRYAHDVRNLLEMDALVDVYGVGDDGTRCQCRRVQRRNLLKFGVVLPKYLLIFIIQPITFVLIKQLHGLCSELAVVYVCIFPCFLSVFSLLFSHFYMFVIAYSLL